MFLLVAALSEEVAGILRTGGYFPIEAPHPFMAFRSRGQTGLSRAVDTVVVLTGTGRERATKATQWALSEFSPEAVMSIGFGGGTREALQPGDLVLGTELYRLDGSPFYWDSNQLGAPLRPDRGLLGRARNAVEIAGIDFELGPIINLPTIAKTAGMKRWLGKSLGASAVDMESFMVCEVAQDNETPFVAVRAIVDTVDQDLPELVLQVDQGPNGGRVVPALKYLARHPFEISSLTRLAKAAVQARRSLSGFISEFQSELAASGGISHTSQTV
jgi:nucleoside phosphorylase